MPVVELIGDAATYSTDGRRRGCLHITADNLWRTIARHAGNCTKLVAKTDTNVLFDIVTNKGNLTPRGYKLLIDCTAHDKDLQALIASVRRP